MDTDQKNLLPPIATLLEGMVKKNAYFPRRIGGAMHVQEHPDYAVVNSGLMTDTFNLVISRAARQPQASSIGCIARSFSDGGLPVAWWTCRELSDVAFTRALGEAGFLEDEDSVGMLAELGSLPSVDNPPGFRVRQIFDAEDVVCFGELIGALFDPPEASVSAFYGKVAELGIDDAEPLKLFIGEIGGRAVSTAALYVDADTAHVFDISTTAEARMRGFATAATRAVLAHARDRLGANQAALQASPDGLNVYRRLGFQQVCSFQVYSNRDTVLERSNDRYPR